ncbi:MAG: N-acetylmuramoyl-L-alanine amidase [Epsilonproteobacteria bacterium]|nr:N-acetylmuramoyl-L-alanine amidase [Campylobacterota bacterium]
MSFLRALFIISTLFLFLNGTNLLKDVRIKDDYLELTFKRAVKKREFKKSSFEKDGITKYIFDFKNTYLLPSKALHLDINSKNLKRVKVAQFKRDIVRVVIESFKKNRLSYSQEVKGKGAKFIIKLPQKLSSKELAIKSLLSLKLDSPKKNNIPSKIVSTPKKEINKYIIKGLKISFKEKHTVVLDPGHGGRDSGAISPYNRRWKEKNLVLSIAKKVKRYLEGLGIKVRLTRNKDVKIPLLVRSRIANNLNADLFVSIHANSIDSRRKYNKVYGIETYFLSKGSKGKGRALRVAARENSVLLNKRDYKTKLLLLKYVFVGPRIVLSQKLAKDVHASMLGSIKSRFKRLRVKDNGVKSAPFFVLVGAQMPAILVEVGYLTNKREVKLLYNRAYQDALARGIAMGIVRFLLNREKEME